MSKHTPGPLTIKGPSLGSVAAIDDGGDYAIIDERGGIIGQAHHHIDYGVTVNARANALLWSKAPELLTILKALMHDDGCFCEASFAPPGAQLLHTNECEAARAAIAQVEGLDNG